MDETLKWELERILGKLVGLKDDLEALLEAEQAELDDLEELLDLEDSEQPTTFGGSIEQALAELDAAIYTLEMAVL
jgi:hypothetical protein